jgi:uncharacterized membrane protein
MFQAVGVMDVVALGVFLFLWFGYALMLNFQGQTYNLIKVMHRYRLQWIKRMIKRNDRRLDVQVVTVMVKTSMLFVVLTVLLLVGAVSMFGYGPKMVPMVNELPFAVNTSFSLWIIKTSLLAVMCIVSFFKFTWVIRQLNYISILMVAAPLYREGSDVVHDLKRQTKYVNKIATVLSNIDKHFITAIRALYFAVAVLGWYFHPVLFIGLTVVVVAVLYRREFMSRILILLS